jgi:5-formyltetrahydrofolate cyclo-ligase
MGNARAKDALREQVHSSRSARAPMDGQPLCDRLMGLPEVASAHSVAAYASTDGEPDMWPFITQWRHDLWLPVVVDQTLHWGRYTRRDLLVANRWGLLEPSAEASELPSSVTCALIPALACDPMGNRLGRGAGFYDRALAEMSGRSTPLTLIATVHDDEILPELPHEDFDVPMDIVVSPKRVIRTQASRRSNRA